MNFCKFRDGTQPHCFCLIAMGVVTHTEGEQVRRCCWCGETVVYVVVEKRVDGHGPRRFTVTYEPK